MGKQAHDDAGRAKAALRAVLARHHFLHRMQDPVVGEVLDGDQLTAIDLAEQRDARIDRLVDQTAVVLALDDNGASAAIAFGAALFGADRTLLQTQPIENGGARGKLGDADRTAATQKLQDFSVHSRRQNSA